MKSQFKKVTVKKLYLGQYASLRDYLVQDSIKQGKGIQVHFNNWVMTLLPIQLESLMQLHQTKFESKFGSEKYELVDFIFTPDDLVKE